MELYEKSWWGKMRRLPIASPNLSKIYPGKRFEIEAAVYTSHSKAKPSQKLAKIHVTTPEVGGAELKVGGAGASPTV